MNDRGACDPVGAKPARRTLLEKMKEKYSRGAGEHKIRILLALHRRIAPEESRVRRVLRSWFGRGRLRPYGLALRARGGIVLHLFAGLGGGDHPHFIVFCLLRMRSALPHWGRPRDTQGLLGSRPSGARGGCLRPRRGLRTPVASWLARSLAARGLHFFPRCGHILATHPLRQLQLPHDLMSTGAEDWDQGSCEIGTLSVL